MEKISHYCQKCRAANEPGETNCWRCGTTLMLVVYPASVQHEEMIIPTYYEDHLLERVSLLELRLSQMAERLSLALDLMLKQSGSIQADHALIKSILEILQTHGIAENLGQTESTAAAKTDRRAVNQTKNKTNPKIEEIINRHQTPNAELFVHLVNEGAKLLEQTEEKQAFQMLERAALLSPDNTALFLFIAEKLFRAEKFLEAREYLEKAYRIEPADQKVLLLLGAIYADEGKAESSRRLLSVLANEPKTERVVNYIWGILAAFENNWNEALAAFKTALGSGDSPEIEYLIGCCYSQLKMPEKAQTSFNSATRKDENFADAWFMSSVTNSNTVSAENALKKAQSAKDAGAQCLEFLKGRKEYSPDVSLPFSHFRRENPRLLTKTSRRLVNFFKAHIFKALE